MRVVEKVGLHGILKSCGSRIDHCVLKSLIVKWITFSDSMRNFDSNALVVSGSCVRKTFSAWKFEIARGL